MTNLFRFASILHHLLLLMFGRYSLPLPNQSIHPVSTGRLRNIAAFYSHISNYICCSEMHHSYKTHQQAFQKAS